MAYDWMLVGLGNPGGEYALNRHNIGFIIVDALADGAKFKSKCKAHIAEMTIGDRRILLVKPLTYMNDSGEAVGALAKFYKIPTERIAVVYDELDLTPSHFKIKQGGGAGGHNGIKSLDTHLPDKNYWRLRCGIGHPGDKARVTGYVLSNFAKQELDGWVPDFMYEFSHNIEHFFANNPSLMMTRVAEGMKNPT